MNFEDEAYVRIYTRDTKTWLKLEFEGQSVLMHLTRKMDRAGVLDDVTDPVADVALVIRCRDLEFVRVGLERLLSTGTLELRGARLIAPNYIRAQTAVKTDRLRAQEARKRRRDLARLESNGADAVTPRDEDAEVEPAAAPAAAAESASRDATPPSRAVMPASRPATDPSRGDRERSDASRSSLADLSLADPDPPLPPSPEQPAQTASTGSAGRGKRSKPRARSQCPADLKPDSTTASTAWVLGFPQALLDRTVAEFIDYWRGRGDLGADWQATLRNRLRREAERLALKQRKPRDASWTRYQQQLRKANEPIADAVPPPPGFDAAIGGLFGG